SHVNLYRVGDVLHNGLEDVRRELAARVRHVRVIRRRRAIALRLAGQWQLDQPTLPFAWLVYYLKVQRRALVRLIVAVRPVTGLGVQPGLGDPCAIFHSRVDVVRSTGQTGAGVVVVAVEELDRPCLRHGPRRGCGRAGYPGPATPGKATAGRSGA